MKRIKLKGPWVPCAFVVLFLLTSCQAAEAPASGEIPLGEDPFDPTVATQGPPYETRPPVVAANGMAATLQPLATQVALDVLKAGGNAVDAVIAANAATAVLLPTSNGLGGDLFAIVWDAEAESLQGLNASGRSPLGLTLEDLRAELGEQMDTIPMVGPMSALTVPGVVDGWFELHDRWGTLPIDVLLAPAIRYASDGAPGRGWGAREDLRDQPNFSETFLPGGRGPRQGEIFRNPDVASTLTAIATGGRDAYYRGPIARTVHEFCERVGCPLRFEDFDAHESEWVEPLGVPWREYTIWQLPPNSQGLAVLQMLAILEPFDLASMGHNTPEYLHHLIEAKKLAFEDRALFYADPDKSDIPIQQLLEDEYVETQRARLDPRQASDAFPAEDPRASIGETTYMTVADSSGNMVSLIQSNYWGPGSGLVPDGLGFGLQNRGASFSLEEGRANTYAPGKRPFHTIIPGFVTKNGERYMAFGATGGDMQPQSAVQILLNHILFGLDVQAAADVARFRHYGSSDPRGGERMVDGGCVALETQLQRKVAAELQARGHRMCDAGTSVGGRHLSIMWDAAEGVYWGGWETRDYGMASGW